MPKWITVARAAQLAPNTSIAVEVAGHSILVARTETDFCALHNICSHQALPLQGGAIANGEIECPHHGARFELKTGARRSMPAVRGVKAFDVRVQGDEVQVDEEAIAGAL